MNYADIVATIASALLLLYWIVVIVAIIAEDRDPSTSLAWILVLMLLPGIGLVLYIFVGRDWKGWNEQQSWIRDWFTLRMGFMSRIYALHERFTQEAKSRIKGTVGSEISNTIEKTSLAPIMPAKNFVLWDWGEDYFPVLIEDIYAAEKFVVMQYFIWEHDELTKKITDALMDRVKAGVEVYMLNDYIGCIQYDKSDLKALKAAGAHIEYDVTQLGKLNYRNHRKITVIDGKVAHSGGFNIGQEYIDGKPKYPTWRDTGLRFEGPAVGELMKLFADRWYEVKRESLFKDQYFTSSLEPDSEATLPVQIVAHGVEDPRESARRAHAVAIANARDHVWMQSPYFVPDAGTYDAILNAAYSGVDVRLMMTDWPDKKLALHAAESYYKPLLLAGGRIFRYTKGFFHAKAITVDGIASAAGTMNLDMRSLKLHKELMVWVYDETAAQRFEEIFLSDLAECREITLEEIESWSRFARFRNSACRLLSNIL